ncbi:hypothetical protein PSHT_05308 [Puccinia striiformis]|uniref:Uncharacterized protein n=1 Tax=Puccinia striiformis TaxID=27350 RepID=A0A2S4WAR1_9BASI|nr:hypothetical protein PSHT_05308 [Puccinia striiformis]
MADFNDFSTLDTQHQGDLVILGFENLISKYDQRTSQTPAFQTPLSETRRQIKLMNSKKDSLTRLYRHLLPLAQRQIRRLSELLVRIDSDEEPGSQLKLVFELQPELDHVLDQICAIREAAFLEALSDSHSSGAEDPGEHANLRLAGLNGISCNLLPKLVTYFREFCDLIKQTKFSSSGATNNHTDINSSKTSVIGLRDQISNTLHATEGTNICTDPGLLSREHDPAPLVKAAIPVLKLTRLFFKKISHPDMVIELQYPISDYAHKELKILRDLPGIVVSGLAELFDILRKPFIITWTALRLSTQAHPDQPYGIVENIKICFHISSVGSELGILYSLYLSTIFWMSLIQLIQMIQVIQVIQMIQFIYKLFKS